MPGLYPLDRTLYAELADLWDIGLPAGILEDLSAEEQDRALRVASDTADSYLRDQYDTPLVEWAYDLRMAVCSIAAYNLICRRGFNPEGSDLNFRQRFEDGMLWLKDVARGTASLSGGIKRGPAPMGGPVVSSAPRRGW